MKDNNERLKEKLYDKLSKEYEEYLKDLKTKDIHYIIDKSYETNIKENLLNMFDPYFYKGDGTELEALINKESLLDCLYRSWLKTDFDVMDMLNDSIWYDIEEIKEEYLEQNNKIKQKNINDKTK